MCTNPWILHGRGSGPPVLILRGLLCIFSAINSLPSKALQLLVKGSPQSLLGRLTGPAHSSGRQTHKSQATTLPMNSCCLQAPYLQHLTMLSSTFPAILIFKRLSTLKSSKLKQNASEASILVLRMRRTRRHKHHRSRGCTSHSPRVSGTKHIQHLRVP